MLESNAFSIPPETMVVTSTYVTHERMPILVVTHELDEEGMPLWQFHCGNGDYDLARMQLVRLDTILRIDPTIQSVAALPIGHVARRASPRDDWTFLKFGVG
jgi:hypothetical protein